MRGPHFRPGNACAVVMLTAALGLLAAAAGVAAEPGPLLPQADLFEPQIQPLLKQYCHECHTGADAEAGVRLEKYRGTKEVADDRPTWQRVLRMVKSHKMPPDDSRKPTAAERKRLVEWLEATVNTVDCSGPPEPGRVTLRRLNRAEYANTIRDLVGVTWRTDDLPADDVGYGFDNIGDVLTLSPLLLEKYLAAAEQVAKQALAAERDGKAGPARILVARPDDKTTAEAATREVLRRFVTRAFRRPATAAEIERLAKLADAARQNGASFETGLELALQAVLASPHFLFRVERDPAPGEPPVQRLNDYELAARLSYFLWSSMPDDELFKLAADGKLRDELDAQVRRMLADGKAQALVENFAGQWLQLRSLEGLTPNRQKFRGFDEPLRRAMQREAEMCFAHVMRDDRSVFEFIDADYTFVDERLARHYGIPGVTGSEFRKVSLGDESLPPAARARGGVLTQASMLAVTSNPTRTSPVKRGKWILENILGTPPPDPPPDVPMLADDAKAAASASLRERMEQHRKDPNCAVCHKEMDALGFALENFDGIGAWRTRDERFEIDAAGELPDGRKFDGPAGLKRLLAANREGFARCLTEKLLTYALGRGLEPFDRCAVDRIVRDLAAKDQKFSVMVLGIVHTDAFQCRRGVSTK